MDKKFNAARFGTHNAPSDPSQSEFKKNLDGIRDHYQTDNQIRNLEEIEVKLTSD